MQGNIDPVKLFTIDVDPSLIPIEEEQELMTLKE